MLTAGQSIGNYRVLSKLGTGGMGAVYLAEHPLIGKRVALKVIHRELASNKEVVQRFFQEARAVNKIGNEHIVEIHDFGQTPEGDHFYIMEYLEGATLAQVLSSEGSIAPMRALHLGAQIASALAAAHAQSVIHRDLKPDNIMMVSRLGDPDFVKVLDFGLAKIFSAASAVKTAAGVLLGTPQYMSPEACEGKGQVDHRTDIYALGVLLFQMMTGKLPFNGESMAEVLVKQVTMLPPAPRALNPSIPPSVEQIILRCLAKPLDARFPTMQALRDALLSPDAYLTQSPPIQPARSVAPGEMGVDGRTMMQYAAAQQRQTAGMSAIPPGMAAHQRTAIGMLGMAGMPGGVGGMPLPAPAQTMPPRGPSGHVPVQQATMINDGAMVPPRRSQTAAPDMVAPDMPKMHTMRIATPVGYRSRPPRRVWPLVLVLGLMLGLGGGVFAVVWFGGGAKAAPVNGSGSGSATPSGSASVKTTGSGSGRGTGTGTGTGTGSAGMTVTPIAPPTPPPPTTNAGSGSGSGSAVKVAKVAIDSIPHGAEVFVSGVSIGHTPMDTNLPVGAAEIPLELHLAGYKVKQKALVVGGNTSLSIELERAATTNAPNANPTKKSPDANPNGSPNGLMKPGD